MLTLVDLREADPAQIADWAADLAENLRPSDRDEIAATSGYSPVVSIRQSIEYSELCWMGFLDGKPVGVFGAAEANKPGYGQVWMLGSLDMDKARIAILRATRPCIERMHALFPTLYNYVDARNAKSIEWLLWAGFELIEALPEHGREKRLFITFAKYREPDV